MRVPESLISLVEQGIIEGVVRPLMSGKEAQVYLVVARGEQYVAKIYKEANERSFKHRSDYTEGRRVRNTRDQRAMNRRSQYGRAKQEEGWRAAEADVIYRLRDAGVRVPEPMTYIDNVLVMELVKDEDGNPAPRLADLSSHKAPVEELFETLVREVVKMLCAGLVHGDLSEFNILAGTKGSVIIDFPQAVDSATNRNARELLIRDIGNLVRFFGAYSPKLRSLNYGEEIWHLYECGELTPETVLTGRFQSQRKKADVSSLLVEIQDVEEEHRARIGAPRLRPSRPSGQPRSKAPNKAGDKPVQSPGRSGRSRRKPGEKKAGTTSSTHSRAERPQGGAAEQTPKSSDPAKARRRRRRRRRKPKGAGASTE